MARACCGRSRRTSSPGPCREHARPEAARRIAPRRDQRFGERGDDHRDRVVLREFVHELDDERAKHELALARQPTSTMTATAKNAVPLPRTIGYIDHCTAWSGSSRRAARRTREQSAPAPAPHVPQTRLLPRRVRETARPAAAAATAGTGSARGRGEDAATSTGTRPHVQMPRSHRIRRDTGPGCDLWVATSFGVLVRCRPE